MIPFNRKFASIVSGGIDSSLVSNYICENSKPDFLIYINHIGKELHLNEIKKFEKYLKKDIYICDVNQNDYFKNYIKCINICNSPINSHSFVGQFINAKIVSKRNCRAIFGGEGADELFGGYETYLSENLNKKINFSDYTKISDPYLFSDTSEQYLFKKDMNKKWNDCLSSYYFVHNISDRQKLAMMLMDATVQMESNAFKGIDLMCMNNSVEGRSLFYRKEIVKFALNLPINYKINQNAPKLMRTKYILKSLFLKKFSKRLILTKQGFSGFPNEMKKYAGSIDKFLLTKYIKPEFLKENFYKNRSIQWKILNTELYLKYVGHKFL
jgi:asparagine synthetase B (glutamine-hydrolysing)